MPQLRALLDAAGVDEPIHLRRVDTDADAQAHHFLGSPTVRVDGADVDPGAADRTDFGLQCRLYRATAGLRGTPPDDLITAALHRRGRGAG